MYPLMNLQTGQCQVCANNKTLKLNIYIHMSEEYTENNLFHFIMPTQLLWYFK